MWDLYAGLTTNYMSDEIKANDSTNQPIINDVVKSMKLEFPEQKLSAQQEVMMHAKQVNKRVRDIFVSRRKLMPPGTSQEFMGECIMELYLQEFRSWSREDMRFLVSAYLTGQAVENL